MYEEPPCNCATTRFDCPTLSLPPPSPARCPLRGPPGRWTSAGPLRGSTRPIPPKGRSSPFSTGLGGPKAPFGFNSSSGGGRGGKRVAAAAVSFRRSSANWLPLHASRLAHAQMNSRQELVCVGFTYKGSLVIALGPPALVDLRFVGNLLREVDGTGSIYVLGVTMLFETQPARFCSFLARGRRVGGTGRRAPGVCRLGFAMVRLRNTPSSRSNSTMDRRQNAAGWCDQRGPMGRVKVWTAQARTSQEPAVV